MATPEDYDEKTAIKRSYSRELNMPLPDEAKPLRDRNFFEKIPKRYIVAFMAFLGFCEY